MGLGTGRCGTASLAKLLDAQDGVNVGHEQAPVIPWHPDGVGYDRAVRWLQAQPGPIAGDVAHAWISLMPQIADHQSVRCVALWRPVEETVQSFCEHMPAEYIQTDGQKGARQFPTYDLPPEEGWRRYVETYRQKLRALVAEGFVDVFSMDDLNSRKGQRAVLSAAGIPRERHNCLDECHENART